MRTDDHMEPMYRTGRGTPTGDLLRQSWYPIAVAGELTDERPIKPVRVLSEGLVLFRDLSGRLGLIQERCTHHGILMYGGYVMEDSLMCPGHGWQFDAEGNCFITASQSRRYEMNWAKANAYQVEELAGLFWAYLGPLPAPPLPTDAVLTASTGFRRVTVYPTLARNWLAAGDDPAQELAEGANGSTADGVVATELLWHSDGIVKKWVNEDGSVEEQLVSRSSQLPDGSLWLQTPIDDNRTWQVRVELVANPEGSPEPESGVEVIYLDPVGAQPAAVDTSTYAPWFRFPER